MIDGLKQEQQLVGSTYSDFVSGTNLEFGTATITTITPSAASNPAYMGAGFGAGPNCGAGVMNYSMAELSTNNYTNILI